MNRLKMLELSAVVATLTSVGLVQLDLMIAHFLFGALSCCLWLIWGAKCKASGLVFLQVCLILLYVIGITGYIMDNCADYGL